MQKVQATTSDRNNINISQQYLWHTIFDKVFTILISKNVGLRKKSGNNFVEVMHNFIIGLDKMCIMINAHGYLNIFPSEYKKKHEKLMDDTQVSITIFCPHL